MVFGVAMKNTSLPAKIDMQLATANHLNEVLEIIRGTSKWLKDMGIHQWSENFPVSRLEKEVSKGELFVLLGNDQKVIGTLSLSKVRSEYWPDDESIALYLSRLAISREYSGQNLGNKILNWTKEYSKQEGFELLRLDCDKTNPFLPGFYRKYGFALIGEAYYPSWKMTFDLFEMKL